VEQPTHEPATTSAGAAAGRIDVHAHHLPAEQRAALASAPPIYQGFVNWDIRPALEMMDRQGIATAILSMVLPPALFAAADDPAAARQLARSANEAAANAIRTHSDRFGAFASLPLPNVDSALAEIDYALGTLGLDGVVLLTNTNGVYLGDNRLDPVFDELDRRGAVVFIHPNAPTCGEHLLGYPISLIEFVFDTTRAVTHLVLSGTLERCHNLRLIVPHAGGTLPFLVDRIGLLATRFVPSAGERAPAGVKTYLRRLYYELAISTNSHALAAVLQLVGSSQLLFGSDWPALAEADVQSLIHTLLANPLLQPGDLARIERQNALDLFPRLRRSAAVRG
jgi:predicted TIM-barrel fold metal-dependent hydrolase